MGDVVDINSRRQTPVSETDLFNIVSLLERAANAQAHVDLIANSVVDRLKAGAELERGSRHEPRLETVKAGGVIEERLIIDGVIRWRRIAGSADAIRRNPGILSTEPS